MPTLQEAANASIEVGPTGKAILKVNGQIVVGVTSIQMISEAQRYQYVVTLIGEAVVLGQPRQLKATFSPPPEYKP